MVKCVYNRVVRFLVLIMLTSRFTLQKYTPTALYCEYYIGLLPIDAFKSCTLNIKVQHESLQIDFLAREAIKSKLQ